MSKTFALYDDMLGKQVGEFRYDEDNKQFSMTIFADISPDDLPLSLEIFAAKGKYELDHEDVLQWLRGRICPPGRQNISSILREYGLLEYDEYGLLMQTMGRCDKDGLGLG
ncbi:MAG: hypothetical protein LBI54_04080 [Lachnospiraceae bacterium]|jgi:hypothetical protein|nr:hypothetical protein [Lachnospiraceae bacterium]